MVRLFSKFFYENVRWYTKCPSCGREAIVSNAIGVCVDCLRRGKGQQYYRFRDYHLRSRRLAGVELSEPPRDEGGIKCGYCGVGCIIRDGGIGWCGLVRNVGGRLVRDYGIGNEALGLYYLDPLPTNCVADPVCPAATSRGYPQYTYTKGPEHGYYNLAVFYGACNLDCLYCQNWDYRNITKTRGRRFTIDELIKLIERDNRITCICYFGGDPSPQALHAIKLSRKAVELARKENRVMRICWESNGLMGEGFLREAIELSLVSGGIFKFDFKAWNERVYKALTGVSNEPLKKNLRIAAKYVGKRDDPPLFVISILLVPGYVDEVEVEGILKYVSETLGTSTPIVFLAFHPDFLMDDLPPTSSRHADNSVKLAKELGFKEVYIGNIWLLGKYY